MSRTRPNLTVAPTWSRRALPLVEHAAWREARDRILAMTASGPGTIALLGAAGTGKTWLLRELAPALREFGQEVTLVRQGDLPFEVRPQSAVLVDEASRMSQMRLAELGDQNIGLLVLAGLPNLGFRLKLCERQPAIVRLRPLEADELRSFACEWLARFNDGPVSVSESAVERVVARSAGVPRLAAQILATALAIAAGCGQRSVEGGDVDEVADLSLCGLRSDPVAAEAATSEALPAIISKPEPRQEAAITRPVRSRRKLAGVAAASAMAATILLTPSGRQTVRVEAQFSAAVIPALSASMVAAGPQPAPATVPGVSAAQPVTASVVPASRPDPIEPAALASAPQPAAAPFVAPAAAPPAEPPPAYDAGPALAAADAPEPATTSQPELAEPPSPVPQDWLPAQYVHTRAGRGGPGLVLVARSSDTLQHLYTEVYRGVQAPPYSEVAAANQVPLRPGAILLFPAPAQGWNRR